MQSASYLVPRSLVVGEAEGEISHHKRSGYEIKALVYN